MLNFSLKSSKQSRIDRFLEDFMRCHPRAAFFALYFALPVFILIAVFVCTAAITLPIAWMMDWI